MPNDEMSREEAERWLAELTANPDRMSAKMFQEGYEASLRKIGTSGSGDFSSAKKGSASL
jgi:hypothetical protein